MGQRRHPPPRPINLSQIKVNKGDPHLQASIHQNLTPRGNGKGMPMGAPPVRAGMNPGLGRGEHIATRLNRPRPQQGFPMRRPSGVS